MQIVQTLPATPRMSALAHAVARLSATRANSYAGLTADIATGLFLLGAGFWRNPAGIGASLGALVAGLLGFSFVEYAFHRWLFHRGANVMQRGHQRHHVNPLGHDSLPFFVAPLLMVTLAGLLATLLPSSLALLSAGALACGYAAYGMAHSLIHSRRFKHPGLRRWAAPHHIHHAHPQCNFGVTTPLWDIVLRSRYVGKSRHLRP